MTTANQNVNVEQAEANALRNKVFVTVGGRDEILDQTVLGLTMASTEREILTAVQGIIGETLRDDQHEFSYTTRKATNSDNIYCYPKPVAG